LNFIFLRRQR